MFAKRLSARPAAEIYPGPLKLPRSLTESFFMFVGYRPRDRAAGCVPYQDRPP